MSVPYDKARLIRDILAPSLPDTSTEFVTIVNFVRCLQIVLDHTEDGENDIRPISQDYPHGMADLLYELNKKIGRALGYDNRGTLQKVLAELQDIVNYALFGLSIDFTGDSNASDRHPTDSSS